MHLRWTICRLRRRAKPSGEEDIMKRITCLIGLTFGTLAAGGPVAAHHSFAAEFDVTKPITLTGTLTKIEWINPDGWLHIDVKGPDGKVESWAVEAGAPNALIRRGLRQVDFPVGVQVVVDGFRAKNGSLKVNGNTVKFPDGRNFFLGASEGPPPAR